MGLESTASLSTIAGFNVNWPIHDVDPFSECDNQIAQLKLATYRTLPNISGQMSAQPAELNYLIGLTTSVQSHLLDKLNLTSTAVAMTDFGSSERFISSATPASPGEGDIWFKIGL